MGLPTNSCVILSKSDIRSQISPWLNLKFLTDRNDPHMIFIRILLLTFQGLQQASDSKNLVYFTRSLTRNVSLLQHIENNGKYFGQSNHMPMASQKDDEGMQHTFCLVTRIFAAVHLDSSFIPLYMYMSYLGKEVSIHTNIRYQHITCFSLMRWHTHRPDLVTTGTLWTIIAAYSGLKVVIWW